MKSSVKILLATLCLVMCCTGCAFLLHLYAGTNDLSTGNTQPPADYGTNWPSVK